MKIPESDRCLGMVVDAIQEIDLACNSRLNGVERGLVNAESEFRDRIIASVGHKLRDENTLAWAVREKLIAAGWGDIDRERSYPRTRKKCDLVVHLADSSQLWLEVKLAWKAWFECKKGPIWNNGRYAAYLRGERRSHSLSQDFEKLAKAELPLTAHRAVCLIGFDSVKKPMDPDVAGIVQSSNQFGLWQPVNEAHWADRRCGEFRLNVWNWIYSPLTASSFPNKS